MRKFFLKLVAFIAILFTAQGIVSALYPPELPKEILALDLQLQAGVEIIYFGDSTLIHPVGEPTIPEILHNLIPNHTIGEVAHPAYHLDLYEWYVNYLVKHKSQVNTVIIPINMRSFSPEWDLRPAYQFEREKTILTYGPVLSTLFYRFFDTFGLFDSPISQAEFLRATIFNGDQPVGEVAEFEKLTGASAAETKTDFVYYAGLPAENEIEALKGTLVYYYMSDLDRDHRKLQSLQVISRLLAEAGIKAVFYITPINYQLGESQLGQAFRQQLAKNTAVVEEVLRQEDTDVLNLIFDLEAYNFVDTEHLTENGKIHVAKILAAAIEPPQPDRSTSTAVDEPPVPRISSIAQPTQPNQAVSAIPTPTVRKPDASAAGQTPDLDSIPRPTPTVTLVITPTPRSRVTSQAGQLAAVEFWMTFEPIGNYTIDVYHLRYKTVDRNEHITEVAANLYVPQVSEPTEFPIFVYGPGTTGLTDDCAPLNEWSSRRNWGEYHSYMLEYTAQGLIGVVPNYQGFDEPNQVHPYFISKFQARALLDAARAAYNFFNELPETVARPMEAVFIAGYSSGGHAAFAAKDFAASYAPELPLNGVIGHGATTNIETLFREDAIFSPYIVQTYRDFYGPDVINPVAVFQDRWLADFETAMMTRCVDDVFSYYSHSARQMYRPQFMEALFTNRLQSVAPTFKMALQANASGLSRDGVDIPALILQGTADQIVTPPSQIEFATHLCELGNHVNYINYPAVDHGNIRLASFRDTINWIEDVANGNLPPSSCDSLTTP